MLAHARSVDKVPAGQADRKIQAARTLGSRRFTTAHRNGQGVQKGFARNYRRETEGRGKKLLHLRQRSGRGALRRRTVSFCVLGDHDGLLRFCLAISRNGKEILASTRFWLGSKCVRASTGTWLARHLRVNS